MIPGWLRLTPGWLRMTPGWLRMTQDDSGWLRMIPGWLRMTSGWLRLTPGWLRMTPGWLRMTPGWSCFFIFILNITQNVLYYLLISRFYQNLGHILPHAHNQGLSWSSYSLMGCQLDIFFLSCYYDETWPTRHGWFKGLHIRVVRRQSLELLSSSFWLKRVRQ